MTTKDTTTPVNTKDIPKEIVELAGKFAQGMKVTNTGMVEVKKDLYQDNLPDGLTMDQVTQVQNHNRNVVAANRLAVGELAIPFLVEHPKINQVTAEFSGGQDNFGEVFNRSHTDPDGKGGQKVTYGHSVSYYESGADHSRDMLKRVNKHLSAMASKASLNKTA